MKGEGLLFYYGSSRVSLVWQTTRKMFLWHFARAVYGAKYRFCGGKGIKGRASSISHSEFTVLQSASGHNARQGVWRGVTHT